MSVSNAQVILAGTSPVDFPNGSVLSGTPVGSNAAIRVINNGAGVPYHIDITGNRLTSLNQMATAGVIFYNSNNTSYRSGVLVGGQGVNVTNSNGLSGNPIISQVASSTLQLVSVLNALDENQGVSSTLKFVAGDNMDIQFATGPGNTVAMTFSALADGSGTVTSVNATSPNNTLTLSGVPITTSGTISADINTTGALSGQYLAYLGGGNVEWQYASGDFAWLVVSGTSQTMVANRGYIATNVALTTLTLPAVATVGTTYKVAAYSSGGLKVAPGTATQILRFGTFATTPSSGYLASTNQGDSMEIVCVNDTVSGSEVFFVVNSVGNITIT